jgi:sigma-E factor negative regulatory protein RseB
MNLQAARRLLAVVCLIGAGPAVAGSNDDPGKWLERMSTAMSQMNYQGTFVYVQGDEVVTMRITHVAAETGVRERLVSVSGVPREVLRDSTGVRWVLGDDNSVLQDQGFNRTFFPQLPLDQQGQAQRSYALKLGGVGRVAGQSVRNLTILPRDRYRYGYSLWLEEHSAILLKWELIDSNRKPLAKLIFTDIRMGAEVDRSELQPSSQLNKFRTVESRLPSGRGLVSSQPRWRPSSLPPGFELTDHRYFGQQENAEFEHLVYSDGLAAVSVYIESEGDSAGQHSGLSRLGTTHAFSRIGDGLAITVVGDVPAITVKLIAETVSPVTD